MKVFFIGKLSERRNRGGVYDVFHIKKLYADDAELAFLLYRANYKKPIEHELVIVKSYDEIYEDLSNLLIKLSDKYL